MGENTKKCQCCECYDPTQKCAIIFLIVRCILVVLLTFNIVWGLTETMTAMVVNYLVNHDAGPDGFTGSDWHVRDIRYLERQVWDLPYDKPEDEFSAEQLKIKKLRTLVTRSCTKNTSVTESFLNMHCNMANEEERTLDYYCAVVEQPDKYHKAFKPQIRRWLVFSAFYLITIPILLVSICWRSQAFNLLMIYLILQVIPISISIAIVVEIFNQYDFVLCAVDFFFDGIKVRKLFKDLVVIRVSLKFVEAFCILYYIWRVKKDKINRGFGVSDRKTYPVTDVDVLDLGIRPSKISLMGQDLRRVRPGEDDVVFSNEKASSSMIEDLK